MCDHAKEDCDNDCDGLFTLCTQQASNFFAHFYCLKDDEKCEAKCHKKKMKKIKKEWATRRTVKGLKLPFNIPE